ncbi:unnamed protein product [Rotaria sordida]|uniref:Uncharacterized protein n=1 Tax=Rotaria sordida TaxID=392033 RepID=A0A814R078_9BILA|nr:unnamed protein product [Rotaria sordida]
MPSPATHYRRRKVLLSQFIGKMKNPRMKLSRKNACATANNEESLTESNELRATITATTNFDYSNSPPTITNNLIQKNTRFLINKILYPSHLILFLSITAFNRRSEPTLRDIAVAAMIFKVCRFQNNKDIDIICKFLNVLGVQRTPKSMKAIEQQLHENFDLKKFYKCYYICPNCGASDFDHIVTCKSCNDAHTFKFYLCSIKHQIQQLLSVFGIFSTLKEEKIKNMNLFFNTKYGEILREIEDNAFTMIINSDGGSTSNKYLSLWPFILTLNELPIPDRRYLENILVAGIIPTGKKPTNSVVQTCLNLIYEQLIQLELGLEFYINDMDQRKIIHFYNIASCTDKPAAALMENVVQYNAEYGCPKCFHAGELYHGQRRVGANEVKFTIRVYPFTDFQLRTQDKCSQIVEELANYSNQINNNNPIRIKKTTALAKTKTKKQKKEARYGHLGAFKQLLRLLFNSEYRRERWSLFKNITEIDELLSLVQTPSTTQRRFRSLKHIAKYKGSEFRCLFHFGSTAILQCMNDNELKTLLLSFVTAINLASANYVTDERIEAVKKLLNYFVQHFQNIFGLRHMSSNIHSLLHIHECLKFIGPLWFYSTFAFEGIDKDLISTVHGTTEFAKQLIR